MLKASTAYKMSQCNKENMEKAINKEAQIYEISDLIFDAANDIKKINFSIRYNNFIPQDNLIRLIKGGYKISLDDNGYIISWD